MTLIEFLPPDVRVPHVAQARRHKPQQLSKKGHYRLFRPCLRWDFGFTCAICLLHEADLTDYGITQAPLTQIEHFILRSDGRRGAKLAGAYSNCIYACRFCNNKRGAKPNVDRYGRKLLDPTAVPWASHFSIDGPRLKPTPGDVHAAYTAQAYRINDEVRLLLRERRSQRIRNAIRVLRDAPARRDALHQEAARELDPVIAAERRMAADLLTLSLEDAEATLVRYQAIPKDAPRRCRCKSNYKRHRSLPKWLARALQHHQP
jgi:5-methylcytosine-specific restriction endonuclease McrA